MASAYPGAIDVFSTKTDGVDYVLASHINDIQNGLVAAQAAIGQEGNLGLVEGRLTGTTGVPVTTADLTTIPTIFYTPYRGNRIALHDGTGWITHSFTELSLAVPNTVSTMYDVFCYSSAGTPTLEALAWTNDTTRATALTTLDGVLVKTGATGRRYLGSFRTTGVSGNTADSGLLRYLWNYYNRVDKGLALAYSASHTYATATWRPFNNNAGASQVQFVVGVAEVRMNVFTFGNVVYAAGNAFPIISLGLNSATAPLLASGFIAQVAGNWSGLTDTAIATPIAGYNYLCHLEIAIAGGTAPTFVQVAISVSHFC